MTAGLRERADMAKFMSASTMEMIQRRPEPGARGGERKVITVLFTDIRGFTSFSEQRPRKKPWRCSTAISACRRTSVKRFHGDVDKFMGDAVFAHFTGPDMALDAIRCGLEIQRAVATACRARCRACRWASASRPATSWSAASARTIGWTTPPSASAVNLAERLCASAEAGQILLCAETFSRVSGLVAATALPPLTVKGFSAPVTVYAMSGRDTTR